MKERTTASRTVLVAAALALLSISSCDRSTTSGSDAQPPARMLNRGIGPEPETLDPHLARTTQSHIALRDLFEGLLAYSAEGELVGAAASRWEISEDGLNYKFWLRPEAGQEALFFILRRPITQ